MQATSPSAEPVATRATAAAAPKRPRGRPRKTLDERDDGNRRLELVRTAAKLFRRKGFDGTSTRDIAAAVGMRSGSPFYHFKSKSALLYAVMEEGMRSAIERQQRALDRLPATTATAATDTQSRQRMRCLVRTHFNTLLGAGNDFIPVMLYEHRSLSSRQRTLLAKLQGDYEAVWTPVLEALHASGQLHAPVKLARLLILGALNWSVQWYDRKQGASLEDLTSAAMALFIRE